MNLPLAVEHLIAEAQYHDASDYARLEATWFDARPLPTLPELEAAWAVVEAAQQAERDRLARMAQLQTDAKRDAKAIPVWATMTEAEAVTFIQNNVTDLASARTVLVAMARVIVHLRDAQWPDLGEN